MSDWRLVTRLSGFVIDNLGMFVRNDLPFGCIGSQTRSRIRRGTVLGVLLAAFFSNVGLSQQAQRNPNPNRSNEEMSDEALMARVPKGVRAIPNIVYREGHERWKLDLALPEAKSDSPRAAIVFVHGGGWRNGNKRRGIFLEGALDFAAKGYVCITVNYRLIQHGPFPACLEDVKTAVRWLRAHAKEYNVDPDRIGAFGNSAGAHLVSLLGLVPKEAGLEGDGPWQEQSSRVTAVCAAATPTDFAHWHSGLDRYTAKGGLLDGPKSSLEERIIKASPISYVTADMPPFLMFHGTADRTVDYSQSQSFVQAAKKAGARDIRLLTYEGAGHGFFVQNKDETFAAMEAFFARTLSER